MLILIILVYILFLFFFNDPATSEIYTLSLHDALPILVRPPDIDEMVETAAELFRDVSDVCREIGWLASDTRSEEHTSELQSHSDLVCRLLLEKKKKK